MKNKFTFLTILMINFVIFSTSAAPDELIKRAQDKLTFLGWYSGKVDGKNSAEFIEAIKTLQRKANLPVTGKLDSQTSDIMRLSEEHDSNIWSWVAEGDFIASGGADGKLIVGGIENRKLLSKFDEGITAMAMLKDSSGATVLVTGLESGKVSMVSQDGTLGIFFKAHQGSVRQIIAFPDGRIFLTIGDDKKIHRWEWVGDEISKIDTIAADATSIAISPDGNTLLVGLQDNKAEIWVNKKRIRTFNVEGRVVATAISPSGHLAAIGSAYEGLSIFDIRTGKLIHLIDGESLGNQVKKIVFNDDSKLTIALSACGMRSCDGSLHSLDIETGTFNTFTPKGTWAIKGFHKIGGKLVYSGKTGLKTAYFSNRYGTASTNELANNGIKRLVWRDGDEFITRRVQRLLTFLGYKLGSPDGLIGNKTRAAMSSWKAKTGEERVSTYWVPKEVTQASNDADNTKMKNSKQKTGPYTAGQKGFVIEQTRDGSKSRREKCNPGEYMAVGEMMVPCGALVVRDYHQGEIRGDIVSTPMSKNSRMHYKDGKLILDLRTKQ